MLFNSIQFLLFLPVVLLIYYVIPQKIQPIWLLICSYFFYMCWNIECSFLLLFSTFVTYLCGLLIENVKHKDWTAEKKLRYKKLCLFLSFFLNLSILFFFKYFTFAFNSLRALFLNFNIHLNKPGFDIILPVGISFYTFQALGYTMDVYRNDIYAEKNFIKYALFVSFFPQLVAGPIERSKNLLKQLDSPRKLTFDMFRDGILLMLWGFFQKIVLADRIAILVDYVYGNYQQFSGVHFVVATLLFSVQIYCDFSGYTTIAMGCAKLLGIELMNNFNTPYFSRSVTEFWRRWHISLSTWFRDYLYIPLGGNRKGNMRKYLNLLITFAVSGLWHGTEWSYVIWGLLNGFYQVIGQMLAPLKKRLFKPIAEKNIRILHKLHDQLSAIITYLLICFSWIFFRADNVKTAFWIIKSIFKKFNFKALFDDSIYASGIGHLNSLVMLFFIAFLFVIDCQKYHGKNFRLAIASKNPILQCVFISASVWIILLFGVWGINYNAANFIYFQF